MLRGLLRATTDEVRTVSGIDEGGYISLGLISGEGIYKS